MPIQLAKRKRFTKWRIDLAIHDAIFEARRRRCGPNFEEILAVVLSRSNLLRPKPICGYAGWSDAERFLRGLLALAEHRRNWLREAAAWECPDQSLYEQFGHLARHLLAVCPIPNFMTLVWLEERSGKSLRHQKLFKHLGLGNSIRGANLPIQLTKQAAKMFYMAPDHLSLEQAVRWSQVRSLGGDPKLAEAVLSTRLGESFENHSFCEELLRALIRQSQLDLTMIPPIVEFLHDRRINTSSRLLRIMPKESFNSFLRRVRKWMNRSSRYRCASRLCWNGSGIRGFWFIEPSKHQWSTRYWSIRELTNSRELIEEGNSLHHCVAGYARACANRTTSIWSMRSHRSFESHRVLTIEVKPQSRMIVTALGRCNSSPTAESRRIMEQWARREGLSIANWV